MAHTIPALYRWMLRPDADGSSLYSPKVAVLKVVKKQGPLPMSAIAQALSYSKQNLTNIIDQLEKEGLVERSSDLADRRVLKITLTEDGRSFMTRLKEGLKNGMADGLSQLSDEELERLSSAFEEINMMLPKTCSSTGLPDPNKVNIMNERNKVVSIVRCEDYGRERAYKAVKRSVNLIGGLERFTSPGRKVFLKFNLLLGSAPEKCVTTHPDCGLRRRPHIEGAWLSGYHGGQPWVWSDVHGGCPEEVVRCLRL